MAGKKRKKAGDRKELPVLPPELEATLHALIGEEVDALRDALRQPPPVSIRVDPLKKFDPGGDRVPWCSTGRYLAQRPSFTFDPLLHAGAYYVQEASSMFLEQAILHAGLPDRDLLALDLCAAPGGKSTHLRSLLTPGSLLVANEISPQRWGALRENLWKWGGPNVIITGSDPQDLSRMPASFDLIVVDAPCSGEGMFRKDPFAREQWSPRLVEQCALLQRRILPYAWQALAPGGVLIYSTCTWETVENEAQAATLLNEGAIPLEIPIDPAWGIRHTYMHGIHGYRAYPHLVKGEGYFLTMLKKPGTPPMDKPSREHAEQRWRPPVPLASDHLVFLPQDVIQHAIADVWATTAERIRVSLRTLAPGIPVAERKGDQWRPHAALAFNSILDRNGIPTIALEQQEAIQFLKGNTITATGAQGVALAMYKDRPLGWLQGAGNRWNNRYPPQWRIRSHAMARDAVPWNSNDR